MPDTLIDTEALKGLVQALADSKNTVTQLTGEVRDLRTLVGVMQRDIVDMLSAVRGDGNGIRGLLGRTLLVEQAIKDTHTLIEELRENCSERLIHCKGHFDDLHTAIHDQAEEDRATEKLEYKKEMDLLRSEHVERLRGRYSVMVAAVGGAFIMGVALVKLFEHFAH